MTTYWVAGDMTDRTYRSLEKAEKAAKDAAKWTSGIDIVVYRTAYHDEARQRGAHRCASYQHEVRRVRAPAI